MREDNEVAGQREYLCPHVIFKNMCKVLLQSHLMAPGTPEPTGCLAKFNQDFSPPSLLKKSHYIPYEDSQLSIVSNGNKHITEDLKVSCQLPFLASVSC